MESIVNNEQFLVRPSPPPTDVIEAMERDLLHVPVLGPQADAICVTEDANIPHPQGCASCEEVVMTHADTQVDSSAACTAIDSFRQPWSRANRFSPLSAEIENGPSQSVLPVRRRLTLLGGRLLAAADTRQIEQHDLTRNDSDTESVDAGSGHNDVDARSGASQRSRGSGLEDIPVDVLPQSLPVEMPRGRGVSVGMAILDEVHLPSIFEYRAHVMRSIPRIMKGAYRSANESCSAGGGSGEVGRF